MNKPLQIKVDIGGQHKDWFAELKNKHGFKSNTELIRYLIFSVWQLEMVENNQRVEIPQELFSIVSRYLERKDIREKFLVSNIRDFILSAITSKIKEFEMVSSSILDIEIRSKMNEDERDVAIAFQKYLHTSKSRGVTADQIAKVLERRNIKEIEEILDKFTYNYLLNSTYEEGVKVYFISQTG